MWRLGFFFHEMGFGLLSIFLPLYIVRIDFATGLFYIGVMSALALLAAIPASFFWGYVCDKTRRYKRYILLSFLGSTVCLCLFAFTTNLVLLILVYAVMSVFHVAHEPPKNVLISELYSREDWEPTFAFYEGFTEVGWLIGLLLGFVMSTLAVSEMNTLFVVSGLNLVAFGLSAALVQDPALLFERGLVSIEKTVDFAFHGVFLASKLLDGASVREKLRRENVGAFCCGLVLFSLATSILFTPMPIFISNITTVAGLPSGFVFAVFVLNSAGGVAGYALAHRRSGQFGGKSNLSRVVISRSLLAVLLIAVLQVQFAGYVPVALATAVLILMGFVYAMFLVSTLSLSMELIPAGRAGLFNVLIGVGAALGSFVGPFLAQASGFFSVFAVAGVVFFLAYAAFKVFS
jgi:MFS family permease